MRGKVSAVTVCLVATVLALRDNAFAATASADFVINHIYNQWSSDIIHIVPVGPHTIVNPSGCAQNGQYAFDSASPGHKERISLALGAMLNSRTVQVIVEGCSSDQRPKVVSITVKR
jgi:hypothetical protein